MNIRCPIIIAHDDASLGIFDSLDHFFSESGCEEEDFDSSEFVIFDATGREWHYCQVDRSFTAGRMLSVDRIETIFLEYFASWNGLTNKLEMSAHSKPKTRGELIRFFCEIDVAQAEVPTVTMTSEKANSNEPSMLGYLLAFLFVVWSDLGTPKAILLMLFVLGLVVLAAYGAWTLTSHLI